MAKTIKLTDKQLKNLEAKLQLMRDLADGYKRDGNGEAEHFMRGMAAGADKILYELGIEF